MAIDELVPETDPADSPPDTSLQTFLRQKHREVAERTAEPLTLVVRGWDDALGIRYEYPEDGADAILKAQSRMVSGGEVRMTVDASIDVILATAKEIMGRQPGEEWSRPLGDDRPLTFSHALADFLDVDLEGVRAKSRLLCRRLFSPQAGKDGVFRGDLVLTEQAADVMNWLRQVESDAEETFSGE